MRCEIKRDNKMELFLKNGSRCVCKVANNGDLGRSLQIHTYIVENLPFPEVAQARDY